MLEFLEMLGLCASVALGLIMIVMTFRFLVRGIIPPTKPAAVYDEYSPVALLGVVIGCAIFVGKSWGVVP